MNTSTLCTCARIPRGGRAVAARSAAAASTSTSRSRSIVTTPAAHAPAATTAPSAVSSSPVALPQIPEKRDGIQTPGDFLAKIGRNMSEHESKLGETWEDLWRRDSESLKAAGVTAPKDRKYLLRQMQYYRCGRTVKEIPTKPKKEFRGHGPRVQKGKRVR